MVRKHPSRAGAVTIESAFVFPVIVFFILAIVVGSAGVFHYQEVRFLAHEAARYAAVHGADYQKEVGSPAATAQDVYDKAISPRVMTLNRSNLSHTVSWSSSNAPYSIQGDYEKPVGNTVTVTVTYTWMPEWRLAGPLTLRASSTLPMAY
jgi:Flp pilus assembly protein TadG